MFQEFKDYVTKDGEEVEFLCGYGDSDGLDFPVKCIDSWGGEDEGTNIGSVYKLGVDPNAIYVEVYGSYYSYDGAYYEGVQEVTPYEKTVTRYKPV